jgi:hypothetical protein
MAIFEPKSANYTNIRDVIPATAVSKGDPAIRQDRFGFYIKDREEVGEEITFIIQMEMVEAAKRIGSGEAIISGDKLYYYPATENVSPTPTGAYGTDYYYCGTAIESAGASATTVLMKFDGTRYNENI